MSAQILDGRRLAKDLKDGLRKEIAELKDHYRQTPSVVNLLIGRDEGSCAYANSQRRVAEEIGIEYSLEMISPQVTQGDLIQRIQDLNTNSGVHGIMLHRPVPKNIDYNVTANCVDIDKDLEGINVSNIGKMILGESVMIPCTPASVMEHIRSTGISLRGKEAVIVGHSGIVGKPLSLLLLLEMATVTICHVATSEAGRLREHVSRADILIVAVGKPNLIPGGWIKPGAVVVDVGINKTSDGIVGDVNFEEAVGIAGYMTPVPGGVGPVTVVMLMRNAVEAFKRQIKQS